MLDVVTNATVDEPCAVFNSAEIINSSKIAIAPVNLLEANDLMYSDIGVFASTAPSVPPAPVINSMFTESAMPLPIQPVMVSSEKLGMSRKERSTPIINAFMGVPKNTMSWLPNPSYPVKLAIDERAMSSMGTTMGAKDSHALGRFLYCFLRSS